MDRRQFVKMAGMASVAATGGLAGCQGGDDGTEDGTPSGSTSGGVTARYNQWVYEGAMQGSEMFAVSLNWQSTSEIQGSGQTPSSDQSLQDDVLAVTPITWLFAGALAVGLGLSQLGLNAAAQEGGPTEFVHIVSSGIVLEGSYDTDSLASSIEQAGGSESEEYNGYTIYENSGTNAGAIALSSETIIVVQSSSDGVSDPTARVKGIIDAESGSKTLLSESSDSFNDIVNALPNRSVMGGVYSEEAEALNSSSDGQQGTQTGFSETDLDGMVNAIASSANVSQDGMTSAVAIRYTSESEVNARADIEAAVGHMGTNQSVTIDGPLVVVEAEYDSVPTLS